MRLWLFIMIFIMPQCLFGQTEMFNQKIEGVPQFFYDIINVTSNQPGLSRLNVYLETAFDELQFIKAEEIYKAQYEVSVVIFDKDNDQVDGKTWSEEVTVDDFYLTNSTKLFSLTHDIFHVEPGFYRISISLMDLESKKPNIKKTEINARDFQQENLSISDITFVDELSYDSLGVKTIHPQASSSIRSVGTELFCYFEVYSQKDIDEKFQIFYQVLSGNKILDENRYQVKKIGPRNLEFFKLDKSLLTHGIYTVKVEVKYGDFVDSTEKPFKIRLIGMPANIIDLDLAIEQLRYIASQKELTELKDASKAEKLEVFERFWRRRDPTSGTELNELKDEYYRRVQYCNDNFSSFRAGWQTDRGMIYIIFGTPGDIERHPFDRDNKPYEIWNYFDLNRQFIFVDETGFGDFRLTNPNWEHWYEGIIY